ncbi:MAG: glycosyltransferase family 2 protein [Candidatus Obscuribacterales bacterium]|jgi:glycosyltransferase involved in cell wall biosynthesis
MTENSSALSPSLSVMMLTLNEEKAIEKVVIDIRRVCGNCEIVVVDSSSDKTPEIAERLGCKLVRQFPPRGYGNAFDAGLKASTGDVIVTLDCDDTYPVETIPILLEKMKEGFDVVSASRLPRRPDTMPLANYIANWTFAKLSWLLCGVSTTDVHTGMRAYTQQLVRDFKYDPVGMALPVELYIGPARAGYKCTEIFIEYRDRIGDSKLDPLPGTIWTLKRIWRFRSWKKVECKLVPRP